MPKGLLPAAVTVVVAVAVLAAMGMHASANPINTGPFGGTGGTIGTECFPISHPGAVVTDGFNEVQNGGAAVAVIDRITLVDPHGLRLLTAWAVPARQLLYGVEGGYPPASRIAGLRWADRQRATSARVPHTGADAATNLLLVISTSGLRATDRGINVYYHVGHQSYHLRTEVGLTTVVASKCTA